MTASYPPPIRKFWLQQDALARKYGIRCSTPSMADLIKAGCAEEYLGDLDRIKAGTYNPLSSPVDALRPKDGPKPLEYNRNAPASLKTASTVPSQVVCDDELADIRSRNAEIRSGAINSVPLPWKNLHDMLGGFPSSSVIMTAAPQKSAKTFFALAIARHLTALGLDWRYLPLEDNREFYKRRILAGISGDWKVMTDDPAMLVHREAAMVAHGAEMSRIAAKGILENPRLPDQTASVIKARTFTADDMLTWIAKVVFECRVVIVDPISLLEYGNKEEWRGQQSFVKDCGALAHSSHSTILLLHHTNPKSGPRATLGAENMAGSSAFRRFTNAVLVLEKLKSWSEVGIIGPLGQEVNATANYTIRIDGNRNGPSGAVAFNFGLATNGVSGPTFQEVGVLA